MKHVYSDAMRASVEGRPGVFPYATCEPDTLFGRLDLPSLLIVEQNPETSELLELFLSQAYNLTIVRRHDDVLAHMRAQTYHLVFMGIDDGDEQPALDALQAIRAGYHRQDIPVVASVCCLDTDIERRLSQAGFDGFIKRTFTLRALCDLLNRTLRDEDALA